ncbi:MAG TPA: c-type cytochrome [Gemmatimonadales bacterium]
MRTRALLLTCAALLVVLVVGVARRPQLVEDDLMTRERGGHVAPSIASPAAPADTITPAMITLGERVFQGKAGGALCTTCHGKDAKGVKGLGPDLTDGVWLHGDGSMEFLKTVIRTGVMQPRQGGGVMPPYGGTPLAPDQLEAVAAYLFSISHQ